MKKTLISVSLAAVALAACGSTDTKAPERLPPTRRDLERAVVRRRRLDRPRHHLLLRRLHGRRRHAAHADRLRAGPHGRAPGPRDRAAGGLGRRQDGHRSSCAPACASRRRSSARSSPPTSSTRSSAASSAPSTTRTRRPISATSWAPSRAPCPARGSPASRRRTTHTVVFKLRRSTGGTLAAALVLPLAAPVPREYALKFDREKVSEYGTQQVATGPYMVGTYEPGTKIVLVRNPSWSASTDYRPAYLDRIEMPQGNGDATLAVAQGPGGLEAGHGRLHAPAGRPQGRRDEVPVAAAARRFRRRPLGGAEHRGGTVRRPQRAQGRAGRLRPRGRAAGARRQARRDGRQPLPAAGRARVRAGRRRHRAPARTTWRRRRATPRWPRRT